MVADSVAKGSSARRKALTMWRRTSPILLRLLH